MMMEQFNITRNVYAVSIRVNSRFDVMKSFAVNINEDKSCPKHDVKRLQ